MNKTCKNCQNETDHWYQLEMTGANHPENKKFIGNQMIYVCDECYDEIYYLFGDAFFGDELCNPEPTAEGQESDIKKESKNV